MRPWGVSRPLLTHTAKLANYTRDMRQVLWVVWVGAVLALAQGGAWRSLAPMAVARQEVGVAVLEGKIYVAGGFLGNGATTAALEVYDPQTNRWTRLEAMPTAVNHPAAAGLDGRVYVMGGYRSGLSQPTDELQVYDPATGRWSQAAPMPSARGALSAAVIEGKIYAVGGASGRSLGDLAVYDPKANAWTMLPAMPNPRDHAGVAVVAGKLYVVGGRKDGVFDLKHLEVYDPKTGQWQVLPPMPTGRSGHMVAAVGNCIYSIAGEGNPRSVIGMFVEVEVYNVARNRWSSLRQMPVPKHGSVAVTLGEQIFLPAGATSASIDPVNTLDLFIPPRCD